jgi:PAS domain S-box-containing protein
MSKKVNGKNEIGLISLDQKIEIIVIRELLQMDYTVKNFGLDLNTISKTELNSVDLIVVIPSASFNEDELQIFLSEIVLFFPNIHSIVTSQSNSIKSHLNIYQLGISAVLDANLIKRNIQNTVESVLDSFIDKFYNALIVSDVDDFKISNVSILKRNNFVISYIDSPTQIESLISHEDFDLVIFRLKDNRCISEYLKILKEIEEYKHISLIVIYDENNSGSLELYSNTEAEAYLSFPIDDEVLLNTSLSCAKKSNVLKRRNIEYTKYFYEREKEHNILGKHALVSTSDREGNITYVNDLFCKTSGYDVASLLGKNHRIIKSTRHSKEFYCDMWRTISAGNTWQGEICNLRKDGTEYWVESTITAFMDADGKPYQYTAIRTDITEQKMIQMKLSSTLGILEKTNEAAKIGFWEYDARKKYFSWSAQTKIIHEVDPDYQPSPKSALDFYIDGPYRKKMEAVFKLAVREQIPFDEEFEIKTEKGNRLWVRVIGMPEKNKGQLGKVYGLFQDITDNKSVLLDLLIAKEGAEAASLAKSQFLSQMSHELRTPLNAILGFAQLLNQCDSLAADQYEDVGEILMAGRHLLKLINEVLDLSAIEAGKISFSFEPVRLDDLLKECCQLIAPLAKENRLTINNEVPDNVFVKADRHKLKQVMINLINNAIKYNFEDGYITIRSCTDEFSNVVLEIENSGVSIPSNKISEIFRPFTRLDSKGPNAEGSGVGLSVCKNLISLMGGSIGLQERLVDRNIFWVKLPRDYPDNGEHSSKSNVDGGDFLVNVEPKRILYVEDNPANLKLVASILSHRKSVHFYTAHTPEIGIELALKNNFDLILLDINLPGMDGFELMSKLKNLKNYHDKPFVAISANAMPEYIEKAGATGFRDYITKPIDVSEFDQIVDGLLV